MPVHRRLVARGSGFLCLLLVLSLVLVACGGGESNPTPTTEATTASAATPSATATTAAAATPAATPTPTEVATEEATPAPTEFAGGVVSIDALWFGQDAAGAPVGGTSSVRVEVSKKQDDTLRVGFFESEVGGSGDQWRAAGWMAVITSALLLGFDPSDYAFSFDVAGRIDGPSAGALMTIAVLAGYLGDEVDPNLTMTGTINPDGTIGPVGGIPHKLHGARDKGKTIVLVPGGQRYDYDYGLGQAVDVVDAGRRDGLDVRLVGDIYEAYQIATGSELPRFDTGGGGAAFPQRAFDKYRAGALSWIARYQEERNRFGSLPADIQEYRQETIDWADYYASEADRALAQGQAAVAYENAVYAASNARFAAQAAELDNLYYNLGLDPLLARLDSVSAATTRMNAVLERLKAENPRTASETVVLMDAYSNLAVAQGLVYQAQGAIDDVMSLPEPTEDDILAAIYSAAYNYANADIFLDLAEDNVETGFGFGSAPAPDQELLTAMSETLRRGAEANIAYFESLIVNPWAQQNGIHPDIARYYFMQYDGDYLNAVAASAGGANLAASLFEPQQVAQLTLGSALSAYSSSATVIAKYYSLGAQLDENANVYDYQRSGVLADMLDLADQHADEILRSVSSEDPVSALYYYENARIFRQGGPDAQLDALNYYWQSAILGQLLGIFSGALSAE